MGLLEDIFTASFRGEPSPRLPKWAAWEHISKGKTHCPVCLRLDSCWFADDKKPKLPQHMFCHCTVHPLSLSFVLKHAAAECNIRKFSEYVFNPKYVEKNGKLRLFALWGFNILDLEFLKEEFLKQALDVYIKGQYTLGKLNEHGQHVDIVIELERKNNGETVAFVSGWMVDPNGKIRCNTPYGGKVKK